MSKIQKYIEDAVNAAVSEVKTKGVEIKDVSIDNGVHVDNGDLTDVLLKLAEAQAIIAEAVVSVSKSKPTINQSSAMSFNAVDDKPYKFEVNK
jgi:NAD(P)H-hydrate repair Nnr-like enzyme with NAD(P)H-hydrate epimerase domain